MNNTARWVAGVVGVALAVGVVFWRVSHEQAIKAKRGYAVQQLRDPGSVEFRNEQMTDAGWLCGEMNSKNAYGAYTGFSRFMSLGEENAWIDGSGYAGKKRDAIGSANSVIELLDAKIAVLDMRNKLQADGVAGIEPLSEEALTEKANSHLFAQKWAKHCT